MAPKECPRCPKASPYFASHAKHPDSILKCLHQIPLTEDSPYAQTVNDVWPGLTASRKDMDEATQKIYDETFDAIHGTAARSAADIEGGDGRTGHDFEKAELIYGILKRGEIDFGGLSVTKQLAERVVEVVMLKREGEGKGFGKAKEKGKGKGGKVVEEQKGGGGPKPPAEKGRKFSLQELDAALSTSDAGTSTTAVTSTISASTSAGPAAVVAPQPTTTAQTTTSSQPPPATQPSTSASLPAPATTQATGPAPAAVPATHTTIPSIQHALPPAPPANVPYTNPAAQSTNTSNLQRTNVANAMAYVNTVADSIVQAERSHQHGQNMTAGLAALNATQQQAAREKVIAKYGLRTGFSQPTQGLRLETNHLTMTWPTNLHVYQVELQRDTQRITNANTGNVTYKPVMVKAAWDKMEIMRILRTQHAAHFGGRLSTHHDRYVTDGDLIWSTVPLCHPTDPRHSPPPLLGTLPPAAGLRIQYLNETGNILFLQRAQITWKMDINLAQPVGDLFYDQNAASFRDSVPNILTRGLNAFFTKYVRGREGSNANNITWTSLNKSFLNVTGAPLDGGRTMRALNGFFLSVRPGVDNMFININTATSPFFTSPLTVQQFITRGIADHRSPHEIYSYLKKLKVRIKYPVNNENAAFPQHTSRFRFIIEVGNTHLSNETRTSQAFPGLNNVGHFYDATTSPFVGHAVFPQPALSDVGDDYAINVGKAVTPTNHARTEWYPASQLIIVEWQPFKGGRLLSSQTANMVTAACHPAFRQRQMILGTNNASGLGHFGFAGQASGNNQAGLHNLHMRAGTQFIEIPARWLTTPAVQYTTERRMNDNRSDAANARIHKAGDVKLASWNLKDMAFASTHFMDAIPILDIANTGFNAQAYNLLRQKLRAHGLLPNMQVPIVLHAPGVIPGNALNGAWEANFTTALYALLAQTRTQLHANKDYQIRAPVLVVIPQKHFDIYASIKRVADQQTGIRTIVAAADKSIAVWNPQTVSNLALKYNIKTGGDNHYISDTTFDALRANSGRADTIVLGADVTHPGAGSVKACPSIAAVVGSIDDNFMRFPGSMRLQQNKREDIVDLAEMVKERIVDWARNHSNQMPQNILFYRDGVSESQYDIIRRRELPQVQLGLNRAYRFLNPGAPPNNPPADAPAAAPGASAATTAQGQLSSEQKAQLQKQREEAAADAIENHANNRPFNFTFIVVGKRHNTRFYPTPNAPTQETSNGGNVKPGFVVDQVITHPYNMDFYLQAHLPLQGTGRSAHYVVLRNTMPLSIDALQSITHTFHYTYARATRGVSYCAPAYYADRLCDRGRYYIRERLIGANYTPPLMFANETWAQYCTRIAQLEQGGNYFKPAALNAPAVYGGPRENPWHPAMDGTMFYL